AFRAMEREQVDAVCAVAAGREAVAQVGDERRSVPLEAKRESDQAREVLLADLLALAELVRRPLEPAGLERRRAHAGARRPGRTLQPPTDAPRRVAPEQPRSLEGKPG